MTERALWLVFLILGVLVLVNSGREPAPLNMLFIPHNAVVALANILVSVSGLLFALWARATLGRNWGGSVTLKEGHELVQRGPYGLVRHPIYTGVLTMVLGSAILAGQIGAFLGLGLFFIGIWIKLKQEEALMLRQFSNAYAAYRERLQRITREWDAFSNSYRIEREERAIGR